MNHGLQYDVCRKGGAVGGDLVPEVAREWNVEWLKLLSLRGGHLPYRIDRGFTLHVVKPYMSMVCVLV